MSRSKSKNKGSMLAAVLSTLAALVMVTTLYTVNKVWTDPNFSYVDGIIINGGSYQVSALIVEDTLEKMPTAHLKQLVDEGWSIAFIKQLTGIDSSTTLDEFSQGGAINPKDKKIYLTPDLRTLHSIIGHELGHALDYSYGNGENTALSDSEQFQNIYSQENKNKGVISSEFFANVYAENLISSKDTNSKYPLAIQYIQSIS